MRSVQVIIVGQGFAGTAVAWTLESRSVDYVVIDSGDMQTSSRIAAGLVTPITGKRFVKTWEWDDAWKRAQSFYPNIERRIGITFWNVQSSLRLFASDEERVNAHARVASYSDLISLYSPVLASDSCIDQTYGGFVMNEAARLDGQVYLDVSRNAFLQRDAYLQASLDLNHDIQTRLDSIEIPRLGIRSQRLIFCQGYSPTDNPWFPNLPLVPAQGDILTLHVPDLDETRTIHRDLWITPESIARKNIASSHYLVGSTYRWQGLDGLPSLDARQEILGKLSKWLDRKVDVLNHRSAIRPTSFDQKPLMGQSPLTPAIWALNGLGAKGTLMAPWCAEQLVAAMMDGAEIRSSLALDRRLR